MPAYSLSSTLLHALSSAFLASSAPPGPPPPLLSLSLSRSNDDAPPSTNAADARSRRALRPPPPPLPPGVERTKVRCELRRAEGPGGEGRCEAELEVGARARVRRGEWSVEAGCCGQEERVSSSTG